MNFDILSLCAGLALGALVTVLLAGRKFARIGAENAALKRMAAEMDKAERRFSDQFENLANRIFEEKAERLKKDSQEGLGQILGPLRERLNEFQKKVDESFGAQAKEQYSLKNEIEKIVTGSRLISAQAENLARALKGDVKTQGNWGEMILEKILEDAGLARGVNYSTQESFRDAETGAQLRPDVIVNLPEGKHVIIDSKVSLTAYERYCAEEDAEARGTHLSALLASLAQHADGLSRRRYQDTPELGTPDFVLMFLPVEGAYSLAVQNAPDLHRQAWEKKVVIVCPTTLFATLKTVDSLWRIERQNRYTLEIAKKGGDLYDKVAGFVEDMQGLGKKIDAAAGAWDSAFRKLSSGPGNLVRRTEEMKALGLKAAKKMPVLAEDEAESPLKIAENG